MEKILSLINRISRGNCEITEETVRLINEELSTQISRKLNEKKRGLDSQILAAINTAITEKVLPGLQESLDTRKSGLTAKMDHQSAGLDRNRQEYWRYWN